MLSEEVFSVIGNVALFAAGAVWTAAVEASTRLVSIVDVLV